VILRKILQALVIVPALMALAPDKTPAMLHVDHSPSLPSGINGNAFSVWIPLSQPHCKGLKQDNGSREAIHGVEVLSRIARISSAMAAPCLDGKKEVMRG
jgi:hypothetical protein